MADPRWLDPAVDANDREPGRCYLGDPRLINDSPGGLGRFTTLRSWLSQWSHDRSNADGVACGRRISVPVLVIGNSADDACTPSHTERLYDGGGAGAARAAHRCRAPLIITPSSPTSWPKRPGW